MEQSIIHLLIFYDFFKNQVPNFTTPKSWQSDFDEFHETLSSKTMGRLLKHVHRLNIISDEIESSLQLALKKRNHLAHSFFDFHALDFVHEAGRNKMIETLKDDTQFFVQVDEEIEELSLSMAAKYGLTQEVFDEYEAEFYQSICI